MNVLVVDDDIDTRESLGELFELADFEVVTAADGAEAMRILRDTERRLPCVVILDLIMPVLSGNELYGRMQSDSRLCTIPVIVTTSDPSRAPSGVLIMKKPIDFQRLLGAVRQYCCRAALNPDRHDAARTAGRPRDA